MSKKIIICAIVLFLAGSANAIPTVYTDRSNWETAVYGVYWEENFDDATLRPELTITSQWSSGGWSSAAGGVWYDEVSSANSTTISFATQMIAFGGNWDLAGPSGPGSGIAVYIDGTTLVGTEISKNSAGGFWGFVSDTNFSSVVLKKGTQGSLPQSVEKFYLDNMVYAPAPGAILLGSIGVGLVGWLRRRRTL